MCNAEKKSAGELDEKAMYAVCGGAGVDIKGKITEGEPNLAASAENIQTAESEYKDADMAKEMTEFTKNNILMQAATAMLSQANQQNQRVISLLQ